MRILILSDSHGDKGTVKRIITSQPQAEAVIFCGDVLEDIEGAIPLFPEKKFYTVRGNCDIGSMQPPVLVCELCGKKILITHGHTYYVKSSDSDLVFAARSQGCQIVVYGHTHVPRADYEDGLYIVNPGSCHGYGGTFAVIDITPGGIVPVIMKSSN